MAGALTVICYGKIAGAQLRPLRGESACSQVPIALPSPVGAGPGTRLPFLRTSGSTTAGCDVIIRMLLFFRPPWFPERRWHVRRRRGVSLPGCGAPIPNPAVRARGRCAYHRPPVQAFTHRPLGDSMCGTWIPRRPGFSKCFFAPRSLQVRNRSLRRAFPWRVFLRRLRLWKDRDADMLLSAEKDSNGACLFFLSKDDSCFGLVTRPSPF